MDEFFECRNQALNVARFAKIARRSIANRIAAACHIRGDDGPSEGRGFQKRSWNAFVVVGREHDAVGFFHRRADVFGDAEIVD